MELNFKPGTIVYRVWRTGEGIYAKRFFVIECDGTNLICKNEQGEFYKFNYFEDNILCDKDVANELYLSYKKDYGVMKEKFCDKYSTKQFAKTQVKSQNSGVNSGVSFVKTGGYRKPKKSKKNILETLQENGFGSYKLTSDRMKEKINSASPKNNQEGSNFNDEFDNIKTVIESNKNAGFASYKGGARSIAKRVKVGSTVGILYSGDSQIEYYTIVKAEYSIVPKFASGRSRNKIIAEKNSKGADINKNEITEDSPIAKALMGKVVGERFAVRDKNISGCIMSIR